jgi:hypothetical protein
MSSIRHQVRLARDAFRSSRYPGDLAAEVLPRPSWVDRFNGNHRWALCGAASAVAAGVVLALVLSRASTLPEPSPIGPSERTGLARWLPIGPEQVPLPQFRPPALPVKAAGLRLPLQIPPGVEKYQDLAMQYRELQVPAESLPETLRHPTVPTIPADLPTRSVEWLHKVWVGEKSA